MKPNVHRSRALSTIQHRYTNGSNGEIEDQTIKEESNANKPTQNTRPLPPKKKITPTTITKKKRKRTNKTPKKNQLKHSL